MHLWPSLLLTGRDVTIKNLKELQSSSIYFRQNFFLTKMYLSIWK